MIKCPSCGAGLKYSIADKQMKCDYCDSLWDPYFFDDQTKDAEGHQYETYVWLCPGCGAELTYQDDTDITSVCAYCGSANILFDRIEGRARPEKIIPFAVTKQECYANYIKHTRRCVLVSSQYKKKTSADSFRGIYVPFWDYEVSFDNCTVQVPIKDSHQIDSKYYYTLKNAHRAEITGSVKGITWDASSVMDDSLADNLAPFDKTLEKDFTPAYLSGFYADRLDESPDVHTDYVLNTAGIEVAKQICLKDMHDLDDTISKGNGYIEKGHKINAKTKLFSVWFMSLKTKNGLIYSAINGADGKVVADLPVSFLRFGICAFIIAVAAYAVLSLIDFMPRPVTTASISLALFAVAWILTCNELRKTFWKEHFEAYRLSNYRIHFYQRKAKNKRKKKTVPLKVSEQDSIMPIIPFFAWFVIILLGASVLISLVFHSALATITLMAAVAAVIVFGKIPEGAANQNIYLFSVSLFIAVIFFADTLVVIQPLNVYYYVGSGIIAACVLAQFVILLRAHNRLAFREPPQFKKKGGDDNA